MTQVLTALCAHGRMHSSEPYEGCILSLEEKANLAVFNDNFWGLAIAQLAQSVGLHDAAHLCSSFTLLLTRIAEVRQRHLLAFNCWWPAVVLLAAR